MSDARYIDVLQNAGFQLIGQLDHRIHLTIWWNPAADHLLQVLVVSMGDMALIKGTKSYYLQSISPDGETWARDIGLLHDYLEAHFPELRISFSHFRDVPPGLAKSEVDRRMAVNAPTQQVSTAEQIAELQQQLRARQRDTRATDELMALSAAESDLLTTYVRQQARTQQHQIERLQELLDGHRQQLGLYQYLQREYQHKGSAASYSFSISSNIQVASNREEFQDGLRAAVKELIDLNRYQVMQKLQGGRLNIQVAPATEPAIEWIELWFGGALSPSQMRKVGAEFDSLRSAAEKHLNVTLDEPIVVDGHVRHEEKRLAARFVSTVLGRIDKTGAHGSKSGFDPQNIPPEAMPLRLGYQVDETGRVLGPAAFPLTQMIHAYVSGTTGGGKSFLARVLVEEAAQHEALSILMLDPRNQSVGILMPEDRPKILQRYPDFKMKPEHARGFAFNYFAPALPWATSLPQDLGSLAKGRSIVSCKGLDDQQRCKLATSLLEAAFQSCNDKESESPRLLVVVDEAQLFTRRRLDESAKQAAGATERALDKIAREGRKFGIVLALISQTVKDFGYELASIRQMTTTKIFLRNSDREIDYAADVVGDGKLLVQLPTGTALVHNANWGVFRVQVRPPYSKVFEPGEAEVRQLIGCDPGPINLNHISHAARMLHAVIEEHGVPPNQPLNMTQAATLAGISSKRRLLELIGELTQAGAIVTHELPERGRPRVIELVKRSASSSDEIRT